MLKANLSGLLWAKTDPEKTLADHLRETAITAGVLLDCSTFSIRYTGLDRLLDLPQDDAARLAMYLAGMHDIGKAHPLFVCKSNSAPVNSFFAAHPEYRYPNQNLSVTYRHELGSASAAKRIWRANGQFNGGAGRAFASVLRLHHQGKKGSDYSLQDDGWPAGREWMSQQDDLEGSLRSWLKPPQLSLSDLAQADAACMLLTAIVIVSDWIASGTAFADAPCSLSESDAAERVRHFLRDAGLIPGVLPRTGSFCQTWPQIPREGMRPVQAETERLFSPQKSELPLLTIIEAPMGEGKTEAGIYAALRMMESWHKQGFYLALPTSATANQMEDRVNAFLNWLGAGRSRLLHSSAWLTEQSFHLDEDADQTQAELWLASSKRALLSPTAVGTVDQAMMAAMRIKYGALRLLGLAGKVLLIDEIHAYDAYMTDIILRLLAWCRVLRVPVIMLSATLPGERRKKLIGQYAHDFVPQAGYPLITVAYADGRAGQFPVDGSHCRNNVRISCRPCLGDAPEIAKIAAEKVCSGGCLCVLLNTVREAQDVYRELRRSVSSDTLLFLFHARFTMARRQQIEQQCIHLFGPEREDRPKKAILVATQVVEESLDLDFDFMITAIAPIDLLFQRIGRLHRHDGTVRPPRLRVPAAEVLVPPGDRYGPTEKVYYKLLLDRTRCLLDRISEVRIPADIQPFVEDVYDETCRNEDSVKAFMERGFDEDLKKGESMQIELDAPKEKHFCLTSEALSPVYGDEEDPFVSARTRLGGETVRIAVLPRELFSSLCSYSDGKKHPPLEFARRVLSYSVSVEKRSVDFVCGRGPKDGVVQGTGRLFGLTALCSRSAEPGQTACDTLCADVGSKRIRMDKDEGFLIEERQVQNEL